jgi:hypothetical protein
VAELDADGDRVAESILDVISVDVVTDGGVTASVFESALPGVGAVPDAAALAAELGTGAKLRTFILDLLAATTLTQDAAVALVQGVLDQLKAMLPAKTLKEAIAGQSGETALEAYLRSPAYLAVRNSPAASRPVGKAAPVTVEGIVGGYGSDLAAEVGRGYGVSPVVESITKGYGADLDRIVAGWDH